MTRINVVPVETLSNEHLLAEYKEITRPFNKVIKRIEAGTYKNVVIPAKYCLGKGHETFFFDKLRWLWFRYVNLYGELVNRGFNIDHDKFDRIKEDMFINTMHTIAWGDYTPTPDDMYLNMSRLVRRSKNQDVIEELNSDN